MSVEYDNYIREHRENIKKGLEWMQQNLSGPFINGEKLTEALLNAEQHDQSKYDKEEYDPYDAYFYGPEKTPEVKSAFDYAWLRHIHNNPHHWQYWVLLEDDPEVRSFGKVLDMPLEYIYEMVADWWSFSWRANNLMEIFDWYASHQDNIRLAMKTRMIVNELIGQIYKVLRMQMILNGKGDEVKTYIFIDNNPIAHSDISEDDKHEYGIPELKKYPMPDKDHVKSAIRFFNYVDVRHEKELAESILECMKEYGMTFEDIGVGDENRFKKYIPKDTETNNG